MGVHRAIKIIYLDSFQDRRPYERELSGIRKYEPISRSHEGFIHILHVGINEGAGYFYYVMEAGDDETLGSTYSPDGYSPKTLAKFVSRHGTLSVSECIQLGLALSLALNELHKHGLVHRDVKPSNIIFVNGIPKLADLGLVTEISEARSYVGTEGFIPPEGPGSTQGDIYSLGKTLYEVSTGKDRHDFPDLPTQIDKLPDLKIFLELNEVILRACKNNLKDRYSSAWEMHADLLVVAAGKSVKRLLLLERRLRQLKRGAVGAIGAIAVLAALSYESYHEWRQRIESRQRQVGSSIAYGNQAEETGDFLGALPYFVDALQLDSGNALQSDAHRLRIGSILAQCPKLTHVWSDGIQVDNAGFSPNEKRVLIAEFQGDLKLVNFENNQFTTHTFGKPDWLWTASFSPNGEYIATANGDSARILDATNLVEIFRLPHPRDVTSAKFNPKSTRLITSCSDGMVRVWNFAEKKIDLTLKHAKRVRFAEFSPDAKLIATTSDDNAVRIWNAQSGECSRVFQHPAWVYCARFAPDGRRLVTACSDHKARVWDVKTGLEIRPNLNHADAVMSAEFSPDNRLILTASLDGTARLWSSDTLQPLNPNPIIHRGERLMHACFSPDARQIITSGADGDVRVWDLAGVRGEPTPQNGEITEDGSRCFFNVNEGIQVRETVSGQLVGPAIPVVKHSEVIGASQNGNFIAVLTKLGDSPRDAIQIWNAVIGTPAGSKFIISNTISGVSVSSTGKYALTFGCGTQPWDAVEGFPLSEIIPASDPVISAFFSPNGDRFATVSGCSLEVRSTQTGQRCFQPLNFLQPIHAAQFSPDGSKIVGCCWDPLLTKCYAQVWNAMDGQPIGPRLMHGDGVLSATFSPDGKLVATASEDFTAMVWNAVTGQRLIPPAQHQEKVCTAAFSPDGKWFVTASIDKSARVWSSQTGDPLTPPLRHLAGLSKAAFLADGRHLYTQDTQGVCRIWNLPLEKRPIADLTALARLLSGHTEMRYGNQSSDHGQSLEDIWKRLDSQYPGAFNVSSDEVLRWHEIQAEQSDVEQNWFAEAFHLRELNDIQPRNTKLAAELARIERHLEEDH